MQNLDTNLTSSSLVMIIGLIVVLVGLILLIAAALLLNRTLKRERNAQPGGVPLEQIAAMAALAAVTSDSDLSDAQLIAVITAALMAYGSPSDGKRLVVRSVRRVPSGSAWAGAGRHESLNS